MGLALLPTLFLFIISMQFISTSVEQWFNLNVERSLWDSLQLGKTYYYEAGSSLEERGENIQAEIEAHKLLAPERRLQLASFIEHQSETGNLELIGIYKADGNQAVCYHSDAISGDQPFPTFKETITKTIQSGKIFSDVRSISAGDAVFTFLPMDSFVWLRERSSRLGVYRA